MLLTFIRSSVVIREKSSTFCPHFACISTTQHFPDGTRQVIQLCYVTTCFSSVDDGLPYWQIRMEALNRYKHHSSNAEQQLTISLPVAWIHNHTLSKVWYVITCPFLNFNGCTVEVKEWISNFMLGSNLIHVSKRGHRKFQWRKNHVVRWSLSTSQSLLQNYKSRT